MYEKETISILQDHIRTHQISPKLISLSLNFHLKSNNNKMNITIM